MYFNNKKKIKTILQKKNIKVTEKRIYILEVLICFPCLFTISEINNRLSKKRNIDLATIYRFINVLQKIKILEEVLSNDGTQYFKFSLSKKISKYFHPHLKCNNCKQISCVKLPKINEILIQSKTKYQIQAASLVLSGVCEECIH